MTRARARDLKLRLMTIHGEQVFTDGLFNADPHPGNVLMLKVGAVGGRGGLGWGLGEDDGFLTEVVCVVGSPRSFEVGGFECNDR